MQEFNTNNPITNNNQSQSQFGNFENNQQMPTPHNLETNKFSKILAEVSASIRILEDRYLNLRKKSQLSDQNLLETQKIFYKEKKILNEELIKSKLKIQELIEDITNIKKELTDTAKQNELKVLNKYLDMWEPMQFVTKKEAEKIIEELKTKKTEL